MVCGWCFGFGHDQSGVLIRWDKIVDWRLAEEIWKVEVWSGDGRLKCWCRPCWTWNVVVWRRIVDGMSGLVDGGDVDGG